MHTHRLPKNGKEITLSGDQIWFIRSSLGLSQTDLANRLAVTQPSIYRIEKRGPTTGPEVLIIDAMAKTWDIEVPADPIDRSDEAVIAAMTANRQRIAEAAP